MKNKFNRIIAVILALVLGCSVISMNVSAIDTGLTVSEVETKLKEKMPTYNYTLQYSGIISYAGGNYEYYKAIPENSQLKGYLFFKNGYFVSNPDVNQKLTTIATALNYEENYKDVIDFFKVLKDTTKSVVFGQIANTVLNTGSSLLGAVTASLATIGATTVGSVTSFLKEELKGAAIDISGHLRNATFAASMYYSDVASEKYNKVISYMGNDATGLNYENAVGIINDLELMRLSSRLSMELLIGTYYNVPSDPWTLIQSFFDNFQSGFISSFTYGIENIPIGSMQYNEYIELLGSISRIEQICQDADFYSMLNGFLNQMSDMKDFMMPCWEEFVKISKAGKTNFILDAQLSVNQMLLAFLDVGEIVPDGKHQLTVNATSGGNIDSVTLGRFAPGEVVEISAVANVGYSFFNWTSYPDGIVSEPNNIKTTITMPNEDVEVYASFQGWEPPANCFEYAVNEDNTVTITNYIGTYTKITIPQYINEKMVTSIGYKAFHYCTSLTNITIPNSVTSIGYEAFSYCASLTNITIPDSVTSIGSWAFWNCTSLTSITIPNSVTIIGDSTFYNCTSLTNITIPDSVISIGYGVFRDCTNLTKINVADGNINYSSLNGVLFNKDKTTLISLPCKNPITTYAIPDNVMSIGNDAFENCTLLTSIKIPNSVTNIENGTFYGCSSLTSIKIPNSVTSIGDKAFSYCTSLTNITIPNSVLSIGYGAFSDCTSLTSITIPDSVTIIGASAFQNCTNLTSITIPDSVTIIGDGAFYNCTNLTIHGNKASYAETYAKTNGIPFVVIKGIYLNKNTLSLKETENETLKATVKLDNKAVNWSSSDIKVAIVDEDGKVTAISEGTAIITATTIDGEFSDSCTVTVKKLDVQLNNEPGKETTATGIKSGSTGWDLINNLKETGKILENQIIKILDKTGDNILEDVKLGTGMKIEITENAKGRSLATPKYYTVVIKGDISGDGDIDIFDIMAIRDHIFEESPLTDCYYQAAELNSDGELNIFDIMAIRDHIFEESIITQ